MSEKLMSAKKAIDLHLQPLREENGKWKFSAFTAALRDAREMTGRSPDTGEKFDRNHGSWLGTMGYLALLDQIGKCFKPIEKASITEVRPIVKALTYFTDLNIQEIDSIYALRCSFAHDFSLFNIPTNPNAHSLFHYFLVTQGIKGRLILLPTQRWDGNHENKTQNNQTCINLELLGDLVESVCVKIQELANSDELEIILPEGSDELIYRYSFWSQKG